MSMNDGPTRDRPTVTPQGESLLPLPDGVAFHSVPVHLDGRGRVFELFDARWTSHPDPMVFAYCFTIRPGKIKGWGLHKEHEDRYVVLFGEMEVVLYDDRPGSSTRGLVATVVLSEYERRLMNIPAGIWHATHNIGSKDVVVINFPTRPYDHANPDKYRLPLNTDQIPYKFDDVAGW
jgi:dTDP-4-dehydrorhamnose 3,5-epimerase